MFICWIITFVMIFVCVELIIKFGVIVTDIFNINTIFVLNQWCCEEKLAAVVLRLLVICYLVKIDACLDAKIKSGTVIVIYGWKGVDYDKKMKKKSAQSAHFYNLLTSIVGRCENKCIYFNLDLKFHQCTQFHEKNTCHVFDKIAFASTLPSCHISSLPIFSHYHLNIFTPFHI